MLYEAPILQKNEGTETDRGPGGSSEEKSWLRQDPLVECGVEAMRLRIRRRRAWQLLLDRGNGSAVVLSQLPADCGYTLQTSWRDVVLTAAYHGCHVAQEVFVLMFGSPAVREEWTPLPELLQNCGYSFHRQALHLLVEVPFISCGVTVESYNTFQPPTQAPATIKPQAWLVRPGSLEPKPLDKYQVFYPISPTTTSSSYPGSHVASSSLSTQGELGDWKWVVQHQRPDILTSRPSDNQDAAPPRSFLAASPGHRAQVPGGPGRSRVHHRDFRRRTMTRFTPLHTDGAQTPDPRPLGFSRVKDRGPGGSSEEKSWLRQDPLVECGVEAMRLRIRRRRAWQLLLDRGNGSAVVLSQLPADCGYTLQTSWRDVVLTAAYHGCHVAQEGDSYVLNLLWRGVPVRMSCQAPSSFCCSAHGMRVILHSLLADDQLQVKGPLGFSRVKDRGPGGSSEEKSWLRQDPLVECGVEAMRLRIRRRRAWQLLLDRGNGSAVVLSQLPADCGYTLQTSWRDVVLTAAYHGCHVAQEGDSYVLNLLWRGVPVRMSCQAPSSFCCSAHGMRVILHSLLADDQLQVKVREEWDTPPRACFRIVATASTGRPSTCWWRSPSSAVASRESWEIGSGWSSTRDQIILTSRPSDNQDAAPPRSLPCRLTGHTAGKDTVYLLELLAVLTPPGLPAPLHGIPVRSSPDTPDAVTIEVRTPTLARPVQTTAPPPDIQTRIATDSSFTEFLPELHRPLSLLQAGPLHLEVAAVLPGPSSRLLVHYCLAYTQTPNPAWMLLYHRCLRQSPPDPSQPPPSSLQITIPHVVLLTLPTSYQPPSDGPPNMEDTEVFFLCHSQVCSDAAADCSLHCTAPTEDEGPSSHQGCYL
ncbi:hypothetical protein CRUP_005556 [Coryphaenoides rupestris]|nr:hypothetical protein CRUP_005556 [Coryphaenoides rupestris]